MADAKISVSGLKKTIYIFCIIFLYFLSYHENTQKTVDFKQVDTSPQGHLSGTVRVFWEQEW